MSLRLMRDDTKLATVFADAENVADYEQAGTSLIAECDVGQRVWPRCSSSGGCKLYVWQATAKLSVFSGFLLYRYD